MRREGTRREGTRDGSRRLAVVAGSVLACALGALPFAGGAADRVDSVETVGGISSAAPAPTTTTTVPPVVTVAAPPETVPVTVPVVEPPPDTPLPPPPPPPDGTELDPTQGVVVGDAPPGSPSVAVASPAASPARTSLADASRPGERVWAVVVGVDDYPGTSSDLRAAVADARDLASALVAYGVPGEQVRALYDGAATARGMLDAVDWLIANAGPEDTAVFLFAGHVRALGGGTEAMVTADAGWLTDWFLAGQFSRLQSRDAWFVVAGCYGGGFDELLAPGRVLTAGAGPGELAYESDAYGRSYLAEFVLRRGLLQGGAGEPTVQAAVAFGMRELAHQHPDRQLWHRDDAGYPISLDGVRRDGSVQPVSAEEPEPEPSGGLLGGGCLLGLLGTCG